MEPICQQYRISRNKSQIQIPVKASIPISVKDIGIRDVKNPYVWATKEYHPLEKNSSTTPGTALAAGIKARNGKGAK